jgi:hypothetical protein
MLVLAGITAEDYLQWIRDPDPTGRADLTLMSVRALPPGERIELELLAEGQLPALRTAVTAVGFPTTPEVIGIHMIPAGVDNAEDGWVADHRHHGRDA